MVTVYGMSELLGPMAFGKGEHMVFMGRGMSEEAPFSKELAYQIDKETRLLIDKGYARAWRILTEQQETLVRITELLLAKETLEGAEFEQLFEEKRPAPLPLFKDQG